MGLYHRGKIYWVCIMQNGKRIQVSTKTDNRKLAKTMTMRYAYHYPESLRSSIEVMDNCYNFTTVRVGEGLTRWQKIL